VCPSSAAGRWMSMVITFLAVGTPVRVGFLDPLDSGMGGDFDENLDPSVRCTLPFPCQ